jgi:hypothetical protein
MGKTVREPIQVYLTPSERRELDRAADELGVSRSEVLRQGILGIAAHRYAGKLADLVDEGVVTPARARSDEAPPRLPVTCLDDLLAELAQDRRDR